jgi:hypothetical protein
VSIARELHSLPEARRQIRDELFCVGRISAAEHHAQDELRVCVDRDPQPADAVT